MEVFSAGCPVCERVVQLVGEMACPSCDVRVLDMHEAGVAERAKQLGVGSLPAVVVDDELVSCCLGGGPDVTVLRGAGIGQPI